MNTLTEKFTANFVMSLQLFQSLRPTYSSLEFSSQQVRWDQFFLFQEQRGNEIEHQTFSLPGALTSTIFCRLHRRLNVAKVNTDTSPRLKDRFGISKCPLVVLWVATCIFKNFKTSQTNGNTRKQHHLQTVSCGPICCACSFRLGNMYEYHLKEMDFQSLVSFAEGWYKNVQAVKVLPEPTPL